MTAAIRPLGDGDVDAADHIMRLAFGTFLGLPEPTSFMGDAEFVRTRFAADPSAAFAAHIDGRLVGSNFAAHWGSVGIVGPLTVDPGFWDQGIGAQLMDPVMERFAEWGTRLAGLFTFAQSPKHLALYQKFGFWPRALTAVMGAPVPAEAPPLGATLVSALDPRRLAEALAGARELTGALYPGLDLAQQVEAVARQGLGDTIMLDDARGVAGIAVCHCGTGSEAGGGACYVKFGAVRPGDGARERFCRLLDACEAFARSRGLTAMTAGVNLARLDAYRVLLARGYRTGLQGVAMHRPADPAYDRPDVYAIDDWR